MPIFADTFFMSSQSVLEEGVCYLLGPVHWYLENFIHRVQLGTSCTFCNESVKLTVTVMEKVERQKIACFPHPTLVWRPHSNGTR